MIFLEKADIENRIPGGILTQITGNDDSLIDNAENQAIAYISDMLSALYDIEAETAKTGSERHQSLKTWAVSLSVYYLYAHIADVHTPERVIKDYDDTVRHLELIARGKMPTTLESMIKDTGQSIRPTRYGFNEKRNHEIL